MLKRPGKPRRRDPRDVLRRVREGRAGDYLQPAEPPDALVASGHHFGIFAPMGVRWVHLPTVPPRVFCGCPGQPTPIPFRTYQFQVGDVRWKVSLGQCPSCFTVRWGGLRPVPIREQ